MKKASLAVFTLSAIFAFEPTYLAPAQAQPPADNVSQLASDFCSRLSRATTPGEPATDKVSQLANDFCSEVGRAQLSPQPINVPVAQTSSQPTRLALVQTPGQQSGDRTTRLGDDLHLSVGFRTWFNSWTSPGRVGRNTVVVSGPEGETTTEIASDLFETSSDGIAYIPTVGLRYKDFFVSTSGFFGTDYRADVFGVRRVGARVEGPPFLTGHPTVDMRSDRKELDVNVGYYIHPWIGLSAGYKYIDMDFKMVGEPSIANSFVGKFSFDYHGPILGASVNVPIPEGGFLPPGFSLYGNGAGGYLWAHGSTGALTPRGTGAQTRFESANELANHAFYGLLEGGLAYKFRTLPIALTAGYKYQSLETKYKNGAAAVVAVGKDDQTDVMRGPIFGMSLVY
jgi:hypothetical protein